jgi:hypothetical protein
MLPRLVRTLVLSLMFIGAAPAMAEAAERTAAAEVREDASPDGAREIISAKGRIHRRNPVVKLLRQHRPQEFEAAVRWAREHQTAIHLEVDLDLPPDVAEAARSYVRLANAGHPDAMLHGLANKGYAPPHSLARGIDLDAYIDSQLEEGASASDRAKKRREILGSDGGKSYLEKLWHTAQSHPAASHLRIVADRAATPPDEILALGKAAGELHIDTSVQRHVYRQALYGGGGIRGMIEETFGRKPLPGIAEALAQKAAEGKEPKPLSKNQIMRRVGWRVPLSVGLVSASTLVRKATSEHHNPGVVLGGEVLDSVTKGMVGAAVNQLWMRDARRLLTISLQDQIQEGKIPAIDPGEVPSQKELEQHVTDTILKPKGVVRSRLATWGPGAVATGALLVAEDDTRALAWLVALGAARRLPWVVGTVQAVNGRFLLQRKAMNQVKLDGRALPRYAPNLRK